MDLAVVKMLKSVWEAHVKAYILEDLDKCHKQLVDAQDIERIRMLQARAHAMRAMLKFPEHVEAKLLEEEKQEITPVG